LNKKLLPITFSILFIISCGGGGGGGGSTPTTPTTPAPTVNLSAEPTSVFLKVLQHLLGLLLMPLLVLHLGLVKQVPLVQKQ